MTERDRLVDEIALLAGIATETVDAFGRRNPVSAATRRALLAGLGLPVETLGDIRASLDRLSVLRRGLLPPLVPVADGGEAAVPLRLDAPIESAIWRIRAASGEEWEDRGAIDVAGRLRLTVPGPGFFRLQVETGDRRGMATLIAAPPLCYLPRPLAEGRRIWGLAAQLVSLRSANDAGIGDFGSVSEAVTRFGALGASFLGLSPFHALFSEDRSKISPYAPSSRLFVDPIHLDLADLPFGGGTDAPPSLPRSGPLTDHAAVWAHKKSELEGQYRKSSADNPAEALRVAEATDPSLLAHATFEALAEQMAARGLPSVRSWPEALRRPDSREVAAFRAENAGRVAFHIALQRAAEDQLKAAAAAAKTAGMTIGLYRDLAVGADPEGSEVWSRPERYAPRLSIGAPPDPLAPQGQDWGIAPLNPLVLEEEGLAGFRDLIAANMRHVGALRIDHAFQLQRLFLVPQGADGGAFVSSPFEPLLAALKLASHAARCLVIGEDLGTAPPGFSHKLMESGALSYRVLFFERGPDGAFNSPSAYPEKALAVFTTHDLPTISGWWHARDIDLRQSLDLIDSELADAARRQRADDRARLMEALAREGLATADPLPSEPPVEAIVHYLGRSNSLLAALQLEDVVGEIEQANLPGVVDGHANWRRRLSLELAEIAAPDGPLAPLAKAFASEGRGEARDRN